MAELILLQSGFLGYPKEIDYSRQEAFTHLDINTLYFNVPKERIPAKVGFLRDVDMLYALGSDSRKFSDFDFRESIIAIAKRAFVVSDLKQWTEWQTKSASCSELHDTFLRQTYEYLLTGKRKVAVSSWITLLDSSATVRATQDTALAMFPKTKADAWDVGTTKIPSLLIDVLNLWLTQPSGYEDLLVTLKVIFGERKPRG